MTPTVTGPRARPLVGSIPELLNDAPGFFLTARREYGDVFRYRIGPREVFFVAHPDDVKHVLQDNYKNYRKHSAYDKVKPLVGEGLLTSEGETWLKNRRLAQPVFHRQRIGAFGETMVASTRDLLRSWEGVAASGEPLDILPEMMRLTLTIIGQALFSKDISATAEDVREALTFSLEEANRRTLALFELPSAVPTPANVRYRRALQTLDTIVYGLIDERRSSGEDKGDLLSMLLAAEDADTGERMNDRQLRDEAMTLFLAGHETTANALAWGFYLLSKHPGVTRRLWEEFDHVLGGRDPVVADLPKLVYTRQVVDEVLRLYPPAWIIGRHSLGADTLPSGAELPADRDVSVSPYVTHRHPDFWNNPEGFDPENFAPERAEGRHRFAYFPFGAGPRVCIGNNFALLELVLILATVMQRYDLQLLSGHTVRRDPGITLRAKNGVVMTLKAR